jgi:hypothetical protein
MRTAASTVNNAHMVIMRLAVIMRLEQVMCTEQVIHVVVVLARLVHEQELAQTAQAQQ